MEETDFQQAVRMFTQAGLLVDGTPFAFIKNETGLRLVYDLVGAVTRRDVTFLLLRNPDEGYLIVPIKGLPEAAIAALPKLIPAPEAEAVAA